MSAGNANRVGRELDQEAGASRLGTNDHDGIYGEGSLARVLKIEGATGNYRAEMPITAETRVFRIVRSPGLSGLPSFVRSCRYFR
jgi:hypothetical protein